MATKEEKGQMETENPTLKEVKIEQQGFQTLILDDDGILVAMMNSFHPQYNEYAKLFVNTASQQQTIERLRENNERLRNDKTDLKNQLEDVINVLELSQNIIDEHGPLGTKVYKLVEMVLNRKDQQIRMLKQGFKEIDGEQLLNTTEPIDQ